VQEKIEMIQGSKLALAAVVAAGLTVAGGYAAMAQSAEDAVTYRQGIFQALKWNIGPLAAMAKGEVEFDAEAAKMRAGRIAVLSTMIVEGFPEGSDMAADTDALLVIWENPDDYAQKAQDLNDAAAQLAEADLGGAGDLGPLVGQIGQACKACHDEYRAE
jgi:cytochrome c556